MLKKKRERERERGWERASYLKRDISNNSPSITSRRFYCARKFSFMHEKRCSRAEKESPRARLADKWTHLKSICEIDRLDRRPLARQPIYFPATGKVVISRPKREKAGRSARSCVGESRGEIGGHSACSRFRSMYRAEREEEEAVCVRNKEASG